MSGLGAQTAEVAPLLPIILGYLSMTELLNMLERQYPALAEYLGTSITLLD